MAKSATNTVDLAVAELGDGRCVFKELVVIEGGGYTVREAKDISVPCDKVGSSVGGLRHCGVDVVKVKFEVSIAKSPGLLLHCWFGAGLKWVS